jgi:hypothetical protein
MRRLCITLLAVMGLVGCKQAHQKQAQAVWKAPAEEIVEVSQTLGCAGVADEPNQWIAFRRDVTLDEVPASPWTASTGCG